MPEEEDFEKQVEMVEANLAGTYKVDVRTVEPGSPLFIGEHRASSDETEPAAGEGQVGGDPKSIFDGAGHKNASPEQEKVDQLQADAAHEPPPPRLYWLDWCRTQSVWNVVCGHVWWTTGDRTQFEDSHNPKYAFQDIGNNIERPKGRITDREWRNNILYSNVFTAQDFTTAAGPSVARQRENSNMWEYVVEQGTLHTIPLFFLLSGYISAAVSGFRGRNTGVPLLDGYFAKAAVAGVADEGAAGAKTIKAKEAGAQGTEDERENFPDVASYVAAARTQVGEIALWKFSLRRFQRLILPFIFGTLCSVIPRAAMLDDLGALTVVQSEMWFLYVLWGFASANYPWCQYGHYLKALFELKYVVAGNNGAGELSGEVQQRASKLTTWAAVYGCIAVVVNWVVPLIAKGIFADDDLQDNWWFTLGATCLLSIALQLCSLVAVSAAKSQTQLLLAQLVLVASVFCFVPMSFVLAVPSLKVDDEFDFMSVNMWFVFMLFELLYMFGYFFALFQNHIGYLRHKLLPRDFLGVSLLLLSAIWPLATYWGERSARRVGPFLTFYDDQQRLLGLMRSWMWMAALAGFAYWFANGPVTKAFHRHVTQSAMVIYLFHRFMEECWMRVLREKDSHRDELSWGALALIFLSCFAIYGLLQTNWVTRLMFGLSVVDEKK